MLDFFRKKGVSNVVYAVVIVGVLTTFIVSWNPAASRIGGKRGGRASLVETCVAKVKGFCIDAREHDSAISIFTPRRDGVPNKQMAAAMKVRKVALDGLIERELLVAEAERLGLGVTADEVSNEILAGYMHVSLPSDNFEFSQRMGVEDGRFYLGFRKGSNDTFDEPTYRSMVRRYTGRSPQEFREMQERELLASRVRDLVKNPVRVSEAEAFTSYVDEKSSAKLDHASISAAFVARYGVTPNEGEIDAWAKEPEHAKEVQGFFDAHKEECLPKANHVRHILVLAKAADSTEEQRSKAFGRLSQAYARIKKGEYFGDVARDFPSDSTAERCGDLGEDLANFVPSFKNVASALKPGEMTEGAVETEFGYHLIMKDDPAKSAETEAKLKKGAARALFVKAKAVEIAKNLATKLLADSKSSKKSFSDVLATTKWSDALGYKPLPAGKFAILPAAKDPSGTDAGVVEAIADAGAAVGDAGVKAPAKITLVLPSPDDDETKPKGDVSNGINRGGEPIEGLSPDLNQKVVAFAFSGKEGEFMAEPLRSATDEFVAVKLVEQKSATREEFDKDREMYMVGMLRAKQAEALAIYVRRLRDAGKDDIKIDVAKTIEGDAGAPSTPAEDDEGE